MRERCAYAIENWLSDNDETIKVGTKTNICPEMDTWCIDKQDSNRECTTDNTITSNY